MKKLRVVLLALVCAIAFSVGAFAIETTDLGNQILRLDLAQGSIRIYEESGKEWYEQNDTASTTTGTVIIQQTDSGSTATANTVAVESGAAELTISGLNVSSRTSPISVEEGALLELTLLGNSTLTSLYSSELGIYGIFVSTDAKLTIKGTGSVEAVGGFHCAGIGGAIDSAITINGGTVTAIGGEYCAGIGDGYGCIITINGGTVMAIGNDHGEGIGGDKSTIIINSGTVTATGGDYGVGIGGDRSTVTINSGMVTASGGHSSAGIGGSYNAGSYDICSTIIISGGEVTAKGYYCALGGGSSSNRYGCDAISISPNATMHLSHTNSNGADCIEKITVGSQPLDSAALAGNSARFAVDAYGFSGLTYQWQTAADGTNWIDVAGETSNLGMIAQSSGTFVRCKLTNGWGNVIYTDAVKLYELAFALQPSAATAVVGDGVMLSAQSTCSNVAYQWQRSVDGGTSWANIAGEHYAALILSGTLSDSGLYRCVLTAANGDSLASDAVTVTVTDPDAPITYTTIYYQQNADGKTYTAYEQKIGSSAAGTAVTAPARTYAHYTENTAKGTVSGRVAADGSLVLSRYYDRDSYTITLDTNGGSAAAPVTAIHGAAVTAPADPTRVGCTFAGWYADAELQTPYTFTVMPTENITVYAKWAVVGADRGIEYQITGIVLRDSAYQPISKAPRGTFYAEVSVKNLSSETMDTLVLAAYDSEGRLLDMKFLYANPMIGQTFTLGAGMDNSAGNIASVKAFMLPMLGGLTPLAEAVEYPC